MTTADESSEDDQFDDDEIKITILDKNTDMPEYDEVVDMLQLRKEKREGISIAENGDLKPELMETAVDIDQTVAEKSG